MNEWNNKKGQFKNRVIAAWACLKGESVIFRHNIIVHGLPEGTTKIYKKIDAKGIWLEIQCDKNPASIYDSNITTPEYGFIQGGRDE